MTPSGVELKLAEKTKKFIFTNFRASDSFLLYCVNIIDYNRLTFDVNIETGNL